MKQFLVPTLLSLFFTSQTLLSQAKPALLSVSKQKYRPHFFAQRTKDTVTKILQKPKLLAVDSHNQKFYFTQISTNQKSWNFSTTEMKHYFKQPIHYFTEAGLKETQVFFVHGKFYRANGALYSSKVPLRKKKPKREDMRGPIDGDMIVMDHLGNTFIATKSRGIVQHSSFFSQRPVAFAGMIYVQNGVVKEVIAHSGHYRTTAVELANFKTLINSRTDNQVNRFDLMKNSKQTYHIFNKGVLDEGKQADDVIIDSTNRVIYHVNKSQFEGKHGYQRTLEKIDLDTGKTLATLRLSESYHDPERIVQLRSHFVIMGSWKPEPTQEHTNSWVALVDKSTFTLKRLKWIQHDYQSLKPTGVDLVNSFVVFTGLNNSLETDYVFNPLTGKIWTDLVLVQKSLFAEFADLTVSVEEEYLKPQERPYIPRDVNFPEGTKVSFDRNNNKAWGLRQYKDHHVAFCWDSKTRELILRDEVYLGEKLKILGFNSKGTPILLSHDNEDTTKQEHPQRMLHIAFQGVVSVPLESTR